MIQHMDFKKRWYWFISALIVVFVIWYAIIWLWSGKDVSRAIKVFAGLFSYQVIFRILWGKIVDRVPLDRYHPEKKFYQKRRHEDNLYRKLKVKEWKDSMPVAKPQVFNVADVDPDTIIRASCQAEMDHFGNMLMSLCPMFLARDIRTLRMLFITSLTAILIDAVFYIIQRFNRPRYLRFQRSMENHRHRLDAQTDTE